MLKANRTIVNIEQINDCTSRLNIAKSAFYNFELAFRKNQPSPIEIFSYWD